MSDDIERSYKNLIWNEGECLEEVTESSLKELFEVWQKDASGSRKDTPFDQFIELNDLTDVTKRLTRTKLLICNTGARGCSCRKLLCKAHYRFHLFNGEHNKKFKGSSSKGDDKGSDTPTDSGLSKKDKKVKVPIL